MGKVSIYYHLLAICSLKTAAMSSKIVIFPEKWNETGLVGNSTNSIIPVTEDTSEESNSTMISENTPTLITNKKRLKIKHLHSGYRPSMIEGMKLQQLRELGMHQQQSLPLFEGELQNNDVQGKNKTSTISVRSPNILPHLRPNFQNGPHYPRGPAFQNGANVQKGPVDDGSWSQPQVAPDYRTIGPFRDIFKPHYYEGSKNQFPLENNPYEPKPDYFNNQVDLEHHSVPDVDNFDSFYGKGHEHHFEEHKFNHHIPEDIHLPPHNHHSVYRKKSNKFGLWHILTAMIPLGLLLAALPPKVIVINSTDPLLGKPAINVQHPNQISIPSFFKNVEDKKLRRRQFIEGEFLHDSSQIDCGKKLLCEAAIRGSLRNSSFGDYNTWLLLSRFPESMKKKLQVDDIFESVLHNNCSRFVCK